jgi:hypothetical protein
MSPLLLSLFTAVAAQQGQWVLTFEDDFTGTQLNSSNWKAKDNVQQDGGHAVFVKEAVSVASGNLVITATQQQHEYKNLTYNFTSG